MELLINWLWTLKLNLDSFNFELSSFPVLGPTRSLQLLNLERPFLTSLLVQPKTSLYLFNLK